MSSDENQVSNQPQKKSGAFSKPDTRINNPQLGKAGRRGNEAERSKDAATSNMREISAGYPVKDTSIDDHPYFGV